VSAGTGPPPGPPPVDRGPLAGRTVAVTGAAGFIGSFTAVELAAAGARVLAIDRDPGPRRHLAEAVAGGRLGFVTAPTRWPHPRSWWDGVERAGTLEPVDALVHLGYQEPTAADPIGVYRQEVAANVTATIELLERLGRRVTTVVAASSSLVYGPGRRTPVPETADRCPSSPYGVAKYDLERVVEWWAGDDRLGVAARIATVYGPTETVPRAVPTFIRAALAGRRPEVAVAGDARDYLNVADAARGLAALVAGAPAVVGRSGGFAGVNLGTGSATTTVELARAVLDLTGLGGEPVIAAPTRPPQSVVVDPALLEARTGFRPSVPLRAGLADEVAWFRAHPHLWRPPTPSTGPVGAPR
jgi:UDP-glucose 4-epimerase